MVVEQGKKQIEAELLISPSTVKRIMKQFREDGVVTEPRGSRGTLHEDRSSARPAGRTPSWPLITPLSRSAPRSCSRAPRRAPRSAT